MQCHLATSMLQQLQDKNEHNADEHQKTEQEDPQRTPPSKERVEQSAAATEVAQNVSTKL